MLMGLSWIAIGVLVAYIVTKRVNLRGDDPRFDYGLSIAGAIVGGVVFKLFSDAPVSRFNAWSLIFAAVGAILVLAIWHITRTRGPYKIPTSRRSY
ncbi:MAG: GlsB/YeaQ/YmgE family stress response membrane protein [Tepidisphaeraceae bacterium]